MAAPYPVQVKNPPPEVEAGPRFECGVFAGLAQPITNRASLPVRLELSNTTNVYETLISYTAMTAGRFVQTAHNELILHPLGSNL